MTKMGKAKASSFLPGAPAVRSPFAADKEITFYTIIIYCSKAIFNIFCLFSSHGKIETDSHRTLSEKRYQMYKDVQ